MHDPGPGHPESAQRYLAVMEVLERLPVPWCRLSGKEAELEDLLLVHTPEYLASVREDVESFRDVLRTGDTAICSHSLDVARLAAGSVLAAVDAVLGGEVRRAFCAVRPPGHHATASRGMGFCLFNHVAIAAAHLRRRHGLARVAIVDWDVHHGNGTEEIFAADATVWFASLHQSGIYPFTGAAGYSGTGAGVGFTLNVPLPGGSNGELALERWDRLVDPALRKLDPDFLLVSAGFDARRGDPIGGLCWDDETFAELTRRCVAIAETHCHGRLVSVLEGGYAPAGLASAVAAHLSAM
jgi:acetoin utilization deacetylase AcuC-like enzyme